MNVTQRNQYLEFNNIWNRRKGYEAHRKRLNQIKGSHYYNQREIVLLDDQVNHQILCNQKKELTKLKKIQENNTHILQLNYRINNRVGLDQLKSQDQKKVCWLKHYPINVYYTGKKSYKKDLDAKQLILENKKLKSRLERVQPSLQKSQQDESFQKHIYYRDRMEKFIQIQQKVQLKATQNINYYEEHLLHRFPNVHLDRKIVTNKSLQLNRRGRSINSLQSSISKISPKCQSSEQKHFVTLSNNQGKKWNGNSLDFTKIQQFNKSLIEFLPVFQNNNLIKMPFTMPFKNVKEKLKHFKQQIKINNIIRSTNVRSLSTQTNHIQMHELSYDEKKRNSEPLSN